ncbi:MAG TPA: hypothetical protein VM054_00185 [bacterium]|nr:hypothetical protein [bacterium]
MPLFHYSRNSRCQGHLGGVEKFAWHLHRCLGARVYAPAADRPRLFEQLGRNLVRSRRLDGALVVVDGGYLGALSAESSAYALISLMHGTWAWRYHVLEGLPYERLRNRAEVRIQAAAWKNPRLAVVACADHVAWELTDFMGIKRPVTVIRHGVDTELFHPPMRREPVGKKPVVIHAAADRVKREKLIPLLAELLPEFDFRFLGVKSGRPEDEAEGWRRGDLFLHIAAKEGNSYAMLEAMATDLPAVVTSVGVFAADDGGCRRHARVIDPGLPPTDLPAVADAIREAWERRREYHPREWILRHATLETFTRDWRRFLNRIAAERGFPTYDADYYADRS